MSEHIVMQIRSPQSFTRRIAILFVVRECPNRVGRRWHVCRYALASLRQLAFRGCTRAALAWLCLPDVPLSCKIREILVAPWKLGRFLLGRSTEAAILEWRAE